MAKKRSGYCEAIAVFSIAGSRGLAACYPFLVKSWFSQGTCSDYHLSRKGGGAHHCRPTDRSITRELEREIYPNVMVRMHDAVTLSVAFPLLLLRPLLSNTRSPLSPFFLANADATMHMHSTHVTFNDDLLYWHWFR